MPKNIQFVLPGLTASSSQFSQVQSVFGVCLLPVSIVLKATTIPDQPVASYCGLLWPTSPISPSFTTTITVPDCSGHGSESFVNLPPVHQRQQV